MAVGTVKDHMSKMNQKQARLLKNSDVGSTNFRKLNNAGEKFLTESGVYKLVLIEADQQYYDTVHIARKVGLYYQSSGKPADKAVNEIIRRLYIPESLYIETWESKAGWQGTVRKYAPQVIAMVKQWYVDNGYPKDIEYEQCNGQTKCYHVLWRDMEG